MISLFLLSLRIICSQLEFIVRNLSRSLLKLTLQCEPQEIVPQYKIKTNSLEFVWGSISCKSQWTTSGPQLIPSGSKLTLAFQFLFDLHHLSLLEFHFSIWDFYFQILILLFHNLIRWLHVLNYRPIWSILQSPKNLQAIEGLQIQEILKVNAWFFTLGK